MGASDEDNHTFINVDQVGAGELCCSDFQTCAEVDNTNLSSNLHNERYDQYPFLDNALHETEKVNVLVKKRVMHYLILIRL